LHGRPERAPYDGRMLPPARSARAVLLLVVALALVATGSATTTAHAADDKSLVYGTITYPQHDQPAVKMLWFDKGWNYLGQQRADSGGYSINLGPGTYHLQFVDQRPAYDVTKYAPTDVQVSVDGSGRTVRKNVRMQRGAANTGTVRGGGAALQHARVVAANQAEESFATTANSKGQFAVGGLPAGKYCLFTYDKSHRYVDRCTWVGGLDSGQARNTAVALRKPAGSLTVFLTTITGSRPPSSTVTVTSKQTGQWWTAKARQGKAVLSGLYPGGYTINYDAAGTWLTQSGVVRNASVKPRAMDFGDFRLTKRGGWVTGNVVDSSDPSRTLPGASVLLFAADGTKMAETTTTEDGFFELTGALVTQSGMTIVVDHGPYSNYLGEEPLVCQYVATTTPDVAVTSGEESYVGDIGIDRKSPQTKVGCKA
jgi:hypothetical protein